jgi:hypothetical protein
MRLTTRGRLVVAAILVTAFAIGYLTAGWSWTDVDWLAGELQ